MINNYIMSDFGQIVMVFNHEILYSGVAFDVAKSAVQKYIRRGEWQQVAKILADVYRTVKLFDNPETLEQYIEYQRANGKEYNDKKIRTRAKAMLTNIKNRLIVAASEDVGIANRDAPAEVDRLLASKPEHLGLIKAGVYLALSQKSRLISDYKSWYMVPPFYWKKPEEKDKYIRGFNAMKSLFPIIDSHTDTTWQQALRDKDMVNFFYHYGQFMVGIEGKLDAGYNALHNELRKLGNDKVITVLLNNFRRLTHADRPLYLYHAALLYILGPRVKSQDIDVSHITDDGRFKVPYTIDDFCVDQHTKDGRKNKCGKEEFALNGSLTTNINWDHHDWVKRYIYVLFKLILANDATDEKGVIKLCNGITKDTIDRVVQPRLPANIIPTVNTVGPQYETLARHLGLTPEQTYTVFNAGFTGPVQVQVPVHRGAPIKIPRLPKIAQRSQHSEYMQRPTLKCKCCSNMKPKITIRPTRPIKLEPRMQVRESTATTLSDSLIESIIADGYMAQQRTGKAKKKTFLHPDYVVKGPYKSTEKSFINVVRNTKNIQEIELRLGFTPTYIPILRIYENTEGSWFVFPNIGNFDKSQFHEIESTYDGTIKVLGSDSSTHKRGNAAILELLNRLTTKQITTIPGLRKAVLQHMYLRTVLGVGDTYIVNMALVKRNGAPGQIIAGFDLEETRDYSNFEKTIEDPLYAVMQKKPGKMYEIYRPALREIQLINPESIRDLLDNDSYRRLQILNELLGKQSTH